MPATQSAETPEQVAAMGRSYGLCGMFPDGGCTGSTSVQMTLRSVPLTVKNSKNNAIPRRICG